MVTNFVVLKSNVFDDVTLDANQNPVAETPYTPTLKDGAFDKWVYFGISGPLGRHSAALHVEPANKPAYVINATLDIKSDPRAMILLRVIIPSADRGSYRFRLSIDDDQLGSIKVDL
jgi:hypothetical protein